MGIIDTSRRNDSFALYRDIHFFITVNNFLKILSDKKHILADGATGTNLFAMGLETGDPPEPWNVNHAERIRALHQGFVDAGSDIFLTNSFGGTDF